MANIDQLTVLSNDGASDVVKNVTRTVTEASTTVKGLTGIDIPGMLGQALGGTGSGGGTGGGGGARGGGPSGTGGTGGTGGRRTRSAPARPATTPASAAPAGTSQGPTSRPETAPTAVPPSGAAPTTGAPPASAPTPGTGQAPRFSSPDEVEAALADADRAIRAATAPATPRTDTAAGPARPAPRPAPRPASAEITRETSLDEAASRLASDLEAIPGIRRFAELRLAELDRTGPRPLRTMWRIARDQLADRYGQLTIGELIDRYGGGAPPPA
jgi:hypothetical protein